MDNGTRTWEFELWSSNGTKLADISHLMNNRHLELTRNEAELLTFTLDLYKWEEYCKNLNVANPRTLLEPYQTDIKVKRNGVYLYGLQVVSIAFQLSGSSTTGAPSTGASSFNPSMSISCTGYLNLFKDRYLTTSYSAQEATSIATQLLALTQAQTNGNVGVTIDLTQYVTGVNRDRTYTRDNVKAAIQKLTQLVDGRFDFSFNLNGDGSGKVFKTYSSVGTLRSDLAFTIGGDGENITGLYLERSSTTQYNQIIGLGNAITSVQDDLDSQLSYYLRQDVRQYNDVSVQTTLDDNAKGDVAEAKDVLEVPQITFTGNELKGKPFIFPGDRIPLTVDSHPMLSSIAGIYRSEKITIDIDEQDFENAITVYFDKLPSGNSLQRTDRLTENSLVTALSRLRSDVDDLSRA